ncbi:MAG: zf-HC2 domain-containing protein [Actinobacteria bacterium ATB1]|nr:zf-HC2 domain-containing protein [Actinobacteria bacterium ATB1]
MNPDAHDTTEMAELLSALLDGELDAAERAEAERLVRDSSEARALLDSLTSARDGLAGLYGTGNLEPTDLEAARLDRAVLGPSKNRRRGWSPSKRGRSPAPYFAVAALIAVALIAGLAVVSRTLTTDGADTVAVSPPDSAEEETLTAPESDAARGAGGVPTGRSGLFLSEFTAGSPEDLAALIAAADLASPPSDSSSGAEGGSESDSGALSTPATSDQTDLLGVAKSLGGLEDLAACLEAASPYMAAARVDTGTWQGQEAFFVTGPGDGGTPTVVVTARPTCEVAYVYR